MRKILLALVITFFLALVTYEFGSEYLNKLIGTASNPAQKTIVKEGNKTIYMPNRANQSTMVVTEPATTK